MFCGVYLKDSFPSLPFTSLDKDGEEAMKKLMESTYVGVGQIQSS